MLNLTEPEQPLLALPLGKKTSRLKFFSSNHQFLRPGSWLTKEPPLELLPSKQVAELLHLIFDQGDNLQARFKGRNSSRLK
jgi:hypothetical protein